MEILTERGYSFTTTADREIVRAVEAKLYYIALDFDTEMRSAIECSYDERHVAVPQLEDCAVRFEKNTRVESCPVRVMRLRLFQIC